MEWFLYDRELRHERVNLLRFPEIIFLSNFAVSFTSDLLTSRFEVESKISLDPGVTIATYYSHNLGS